MTRSERLRDFAHWVNERHAIYLRKTILEGRTPPALYNPAKVEGAQRKYSLDHLTDDPIFAEYRFCNVFRELDYVTSWIDGTIRKPFAEHANLWLMLAVARTLNWPMTLAWLINQGAFPNAPGWKPEVMTSVLNARKDAGLKVYSAAYMIRAESDRKKPWFEWSKQRYIAEIVIGRLWEKREDWREDFKGDPGYAPRMQSVFDWFHETPEFVGWGPFMSGQVVADLRHTRYLASASDINTWTPLGPGSRRGLNRLRGRTVGAPLRQEAAVEEMIELREEMPWLLKKHVPLPELFDVQNCLCEFDKYMRAKTGEGRPKVKYVRGRGY